MNKPKDLKHTYQAELDTLPIQLVPPDPSSPGMIQKNRCAGSTGALSQQSGPEPRTVNRLIDRIKKI